MSKPLAHVDLTQPSDLDAANRVGHAWRLLRRGPSAILIRDYLFGTGDDALDAGQMDTLDVLVRRPSWRMSELAEALHVDPSTATRAVQRLAKVDLADRGAGHMDGRVVTVAATAAGRARHSDISRRRSRVISRLLSAFEPEERTALADLMTRFVEELDVAVVEAKAAAAAAAALKAAGTDQSEPL